MLKFAIKMSKETDIEDSWYEIYAGQCKKELFVVTSKLRIYTVSEMPSEIAASPLHAFEMGVRASSRWIAVELLKHPNPPTKGKMVEGVALWTTKRAKDNYEIFLMTQKATQGTLGVFTDTPVLYSVYGLIDTMPLNIPAGNHASKEGAIATIIQHAAPWIAAALVAEVEDE